MKECPRIIESVPSKNAEPIKQWLAKLGSERINEVFDPSIAMQKSIDLYRAKGYKEYKGLHKESLRDNMSDIEVALTDLGEITTRELAKKYKPSGLEENRSKAKKGGNIAKITRDNIEKELKENVVTRDNNLNYEYIDDNGKLIENK